MRSCKRNPINIIFRPILVVVEDPHLAALAIGNPRAAHRGATRAAALTVVAIAAGTTVCCTLVGALQGIVLGGWSSQGRGKEEGDGKYSRLHNERYRLDYRFLYSDVGSLR